MTKSHAVHLQIWQYLDPEEEDGEIEQLVEPTRPVIADIELTSYTFSQRLNLFNCVLRLYEIDYNKWKTTNTNLSLNLLSITKSKISLLTTLNQEIS